MRFTIHYDDDQGDKPPPGWRWWRFVILGVILIIMLALVVAIRIL